MLSPKKQMSARGINMQTQRGWPPSKVILSPKESLCPAATKADAPESRVLTLEHMRSNHAPLTPLHGSLRSEHFLRPPAHPCDALGEAVAMGRVRESEERVTERERLSLSKQFSRPAGPQSVEAYLRLARWLLYAFAPLFAAARTYSSSCAHTRKRGPGGAHVTCTVNARSHAHV